MKRTLLAASLWAFLALPLLPAAQACHIGFGASAGVVSTPNGPKPATLAFEHCEGAVDAWVTTANGVDFFTAHLDVIVPDGECLFTGCGFGPVEAVFTLSNPALGVDLAGHQSNAFHVAWAREVVGQYRFQDALFLRGGSG